MDVVRITELQPKTYVEQGDYIAIDNQSDGTKKVQFTNLLDDTLSQENKIAPANVVGDEIATIRAAVGSPLKASTVAQMTDTNKIYVYVGSESGYTNGNWYYWNGSAWTSGGVYNSVAVVTDPTLTLSGVPADAKATGDEVTNLKDDLKSYIYGTNLTFSGVVSSINKFNVLLLNGETYSYTNNTGAPISVLIYKADGTSKSIWGNLLDGETTTFTVDSDDYVAIGGWFNAGSTGTVTLTGGIDSLEILNDVGDIKAVVDDISKQENIDVEITSYTKTSGYLYAITGATESAQWNYYKLPVNYGDSFTIYTMAGWSARSWIMLDASNNVLGYDSYDSATKQDTWSCTITSASVAYLIINCRDDGELIVTQHLTDANVVNEDRIIINGKPLVKYFDTDAHKDNALWGKVLCCCGDSITYGADMDADGIVATPAIDSYQYSAYSKTWTKWTSNEPAAYGYQIAERNDMTFYNGGVSGATVQGSDLVGSSVPGFSEASGEYTLLPDEIDYLVLFYGWNDHAFGTTGAITDATNDSYYGGFNVALPYLINKYPDTKIALVVPFGTDAEHRQAVRDVGNKWGVAVWDNYYGGTPLYYGKEDSVGVDASVVTSNRAKFQANGAHPNYKGHKQLADMIEDFLRSI